MAAGGTPFAVPGLAALGKGEGAEVTATWCTSAGDCSAGGYADRGCAAGRFYTDRSRRRRDSSPARTTVTGGHAEPIARPGGLELRAGRQVSSVWCAPSGRCAAGGCYTGHSRRQGFVTQDG